MRTVVRNSPENAEAHQRLGVVQLAMGDPVAAEKELRTAKDLKFPPATVDPQIARALTAQNKFDEVLKGVHAGRTDAGSRRAHPRRPRRRYSAKDRMPEARAAVSDAEKLQPDLLEAPLTAARIEIAAQDFKAGGNQGRPRPRHRPESVDGLILKAKLLDARGERQEALKRYDAAVAAAPGNLGARLDRGQARLNLGQDGPAREDIDLVLKADPKNPQGIYFLAVLLMRAKDFAGADQQLQLIAPYLSACRAVISSRPSPRPISARMSRPRTPPSAMSPIRRAMPPATSSSPASISAPSAPSRRSRCSTGR